MAIQYDPSLSALMDLFSGEHQGFSEDEIQAAEDRLGIALPAAYRDFLRTYGKDEINSHFNQIIEPEHLFTTYEVLEEELPDWEPEFQRAEQNGTIGEYLDHSYYKLWKLPKERWSEVTDNYLLIWFENQGVWSAGWRVRDLLDGVPDPPVYISTEDDYVTYQKLTDGIEDFLFEMLRQAADGWHGTPRLTRDDDIRNALARAGVDPEALQPKEQADGNGWLAVFLDAEEKRAGFCFASGDYQELCLVDRQAGGNRSEGAQAESSKALVSVPLEYTPSNKGPYRLELTDFQKKDLGMEAPRPENGIALHPFIALLVREAFNRLPPTAYDWMKDLGRVKNLKLELRWGTKRTIDEDENAAYIYPPDEHFPPPPFYYDLHDWSIIQRMTGLKTFFIDRILVDDDRFWPMLAKLPNLRSLSVNNTWVADFSFLKDCKNLTRLCLYHTGFSDCRLLLHLPRLQEVDLRFCSLEHTEVLESLPCKCLI